MNVFRDTWEKHVRLLTEAVDEITTIEDFLAISENHILEDINSCIQAMVERNSDRKSKRMFIGMNVNGFVQVWIEQLERFVVEQNVLLMLSLPKWKNTKQENILTLFWKVYEIFVIKVSDRNSIEYNPFIQI